jgi:alkanesulfonate monooxygenase
MVEHQRMREPRTRLTFGWYLPSHGDTTAFGNPSARIPASPQLFDEVVKAVDEAGYHYMLIPVSSICWEAGVLGAYYIARTQHVAPLIAFRSGYVNPTLAAKTFATLDQMSGGRVCINLIAGLDDRAAEADGVFDSKQVRYEKMGEEVEIMKRLWASRKPIAYTGKHYRVDQAIEPAKAASTVVPRRWLGDGRGIVGAAQLDSLVLGRPSWRNRREREKNSDARQEIWSRGANSIWHATAGHLP